MKDFSIPNVFLLLLLLLGFCSSLFVMHCNGQEEALSVAPMEEKEKEALYLAIQGFVGKWWNGSDLYPDPCGWTPLQGVFCDLHEGLWYISDINIGPVYDNSLICSPNAAFSHHLFNLNRLKSLSIFNCFTNPNQNPVTISTLNWTKFTNTLESLEFRSNPGLIGTIPTTIGSLRELQSLVLLENGLSGKLPLEIGNLANLKKLVLSGNQLVGQVPESFGSLTQLLIFDSSRNKLSGPLPWTIGGLVSLLKLDLSSNVLEGNIPEDIGKLKNLTLLDLGNNKLSGGLAQKIQEMVSLKELVMSNNLIGGDLDRIQWANMRNLEILDLSNTALEGKIPKSIMELKGIRYLGLDNNNLSGNIPTNLESMSNIRTIYINGNNLTGELGFSEGFYRKFGRRFGAWNNPNLCFREDLVSASFVPFGVKPCKQEHGVFSNGDSNAKISSSERNWNGDSQVVNSLGFASYGFDFWDVFGVQGTFVFLLWNLLF
ncbi:piriformospora indica-insensitive protein 2 [Ziziphus jujuba]|uniref:Piriformospora indica-insensitive protein 2 n=1 Tax=Ziziphus jujuba TaxID=326968 RepID=A0A6P3ZQE7_ZIZJJ|nr:piriformospora indica-insensitive protein 2 [Ziziphus jujuba]